MNTKEDITIEIRPDILIVLTEKLKNHGQTLDDLVNGFLTEVVRTGQIPFDLDAVPELPPIITSTELAVKFYDVLKRLQSSNEVMYIAHEGELSCVIMTEEKYKELLSLCQQPERDTNEG